MSINQPDSNSLEPGCPSNDEEGQRRGHRLLYILPVLVFAGLSLLFVVRLLGGDPSRIPSALIGRPLPSFSLPPLDGLLSDGKPVPALASADLKGAVAIVNIWASWCAPCRQEHPALMELAKEAGLKLVGINYKDQPANARRFLGALGNPYTAVGVDQSGRAAIELGVYGVPETFIVDAAGVIRYKHIGPILPEQVAAFKQQTRAVQQDSLRTR